MRFINGALCQGLGLPLGELGKALRMGRGGGEAGRRVAKEEPGADRRVWLTVSVAFPPEGLC